MLIFLDFQNLNIILILTTFIKNKRPSSRVIYVMKLRSEFQWPILIEILFWLTRSHRFIVILHINENTKCL